MSKLITDSLGQEVEVYTTEELNQQREEVEQQLKTEVEEKEQELEGIKEELEKYRSKDLNFQNLRKQKTAAEEKAKKIESNFDEKLNQVKSDILKDVMEEHFSEILNNLSGGDDELKKKIEFQFNRIGDVAKTKSEITNKLKDAWLLATKPTEVDALNTTVISSGGVSRIQPKVDKNFSAEEKEMLNKLAQAGGITLKEEDLK